MAAIINIPTATPEMADEIKSPIVTTVTAILPEDESTELTSLPDMDKKTAIPQGVEGTMNYFRRPPPGTPLMEIAKNPALAMAPKKVFINDVRGREGQFNLDKNGFQYVHDPCSFTAFEDEELVKAEYYKQCEDLLMRTLKPKAVVAYHHSYRLSDSKGQAPAYNVHIDRTAKSSRELITDRSPLFTDEALDMLSGCRILNLAVWRPLKTVERDPIAVVDTATCPAHDLVPVRRPKPEKEFKDNVPRETWFVRANEQHEWYHMSAQQKDEVLFIKFSDDRGEIRDDVVLNGTPHSSFDWRASENAAPRNSVEVRCIVAF